MKGEKRNKAGNTTHTHTHSSLKAVFLVFVKRSDKSDKAEVIHHGHATFTGVFPSANYMFRWILIFIAASLASIPDV